MGLKIDRALLGQEFDRVVLGPVTAEEIIEFAAATEEIAVPASAADLVAPPTFVIRARGDLFKPPKLGRIQLGFDAGKDIEFGVPIRPGDVLTSVATVRDIYEKTGRSGSMSFMVLRTVVTNQRDELVAVVDQRMMYR
ncbi:MAG: MaoC family dehydratase N-terminal domain-containing protein [Candidatus Binatia bacterium]